MYRGSNDFRKSYQPINNIVKNEKCDWLQATTVLCLCG